MLGIHTARALATRPHRRRGWDLANERSSRADTAPPEAAGLPAVATAALRPARLPAAAVSAVLRLAVGVTEAHRADLLPAAAVMAAVRLRAAATGPPAATLRKASARPAAAFPRPAAR